jgi:RND family efflux transporter MFP subunit
MSYRAGLLTGILVTAAAGAIVALLWSAFSGKSRKSDSPKSAPATILKEEEILKITLTEDAERRLGIKLSPVQEGPVPRTRTFGGEVIAPPGHTILVAAPLNGTLKAPDGGVPRAGKKVKQGDTIFQLLPLLSQDARVTLAAARVDADGQVNNARVALAAAKKNLDRALELLRVEGGRQRDVDDSQAAYDIAQKTLAAAEARLAVLNRAAEDADKNMSVPLALTAPTGGLLRNVSALAEQNVPAGGALFEIVNLDPVWIRVPVFVGEAPNLIVDQAGIGPLTARPAPGARMARSVAAPPSANPVAGTVDLYFTLPNSDTSLAPGERVAATLTLREEAKDLTIPWSAVIHDIYGGTWVYVNTAPHTFVRQRVRVRHVHEGTAVLEKGPPKGTMIVDTGAQELFGTEVGFSK